MRTLFTSVLLVLLGLVPAHGANTLVMPPDMFSELHDSTFQEPPAPQCRAKWFSGGGLYQGYLHQNGVVVPFMWPPNADPHTIQSWRITSVTGYWHREPVETEFVTAVSTPHGREWVPMAMPAVISAGDPVALRFVVPEDSVFLQVGFDW